MKLARHGASALALAGAAAAGSALGAEADAQSEPAWSGAVTGMYYAMRDQPDFGVGVGSLDRGPLHLEARYNYEARDAGSAFVGWKFAGGDSVSYELTPIIGGLFGAARGVVPGLEASIGWRIVRCLRRGRVRSRPRREQCELFLLVDRARLEAPRMAPGRPRRSADAYHRQRPRSAARDLRAGGRRQGDARRLRVQPGFRQPLRHRFPRRRVLTSR